MLHPDTNLCTIFVHDGAPRRRRLAERGFEVAEDWWRATLERLVSCDCEVGCPGLRFAQVQQQQQMLDKGAAAELVAALLEEVAPW